MRFPCFFGGDGDFGPGHRVLMDRVNQIAELPLEKQANIENRDMSKQTALMGAEDGDPIAAVDFLLKKGADIEATNWCGDTPLLVAAELEKTEIARLLLARGARVNAEDNSGRNALDAALENKNTPMTPMLCPHEKRP
jgi:hypothetical protein